MKRLPIDDIKVAQLLADYKARAEELENEPGLVTYVAKVAKVIEYFKHFEANEHGIFECSESWFRGVIDQVLEDGYEFKWRATLEHEKLSELWELPVSEGHVPKYFENRPDGYAYGLADNCEQITKAVGPITEDIIVFAAQHTVEDPEDWCKSGSYIGIHEFAPLTCWSYSVYERVKPKA